MIATIFVCIGIIAFIWGWVQMIIEKVHLYHECKVCPFGKECVEHKRYFPSDCIKKYYLTEEQENKVFQQIKKIK